MNYLHDETQFVPGPFKEQLRYCYFIRHCHFIDNNIGTRVNQLQNFVFPYIKKKISIQAGINIPCAYLIDDGEIKRFPFLDPDIMQLRLNPSYNNPFDRDEASFEFFPLENAIEFLVFIFNTEINLSKTCHTIKAWAFKTTIDEYYPDKWNDYDACSGSFITIDETQTILNKFCEADDTIYQEIKKICDHDTEDLAGLAYQIQYIMESQYKTLEVLFEKTYRKGLVYRKK